MSRDDREKETQQLLSHPALRPAHEHDHEPEHDEAHEQALLEAITQAIFEASKVSDCNAVVIRTGEATQALLTALACILAMSPSVTRSPAAIRKTVDDLGKRLRRQVASAEQSPDLGEFVRRSFRNAAEGGSA